jgi:hypothetical protein
MVHVTNLTPGSECNNPTLRLPLLDWELSPEFDLNILPPETSERPGGVRMISDQLRFSAAGGEVVQGGIQ